MIEQIKEVATPKAATTVLNKEASAKQSAKKKKVEKAIFLDENGNTLKKPLSGFMLYCNHRRLAICQEHPGKILSLKTNHKSCRVFYGRHFKADGPRVVKNERVTAQSKLRLFITVFVLGRCGRQKLRRPSSNTTSKSITPKSCRERMMLSNQLQSLRRKVRRALPT